MLGSINKRWPRSRGSSGVVGFPNAVKTSLVELGQCNGDRQFFQSLSGLANSFAVRPLALDSPKLSCQNDPARPFWLRQSPVAAAPSRRVDLSRNEVVTTKWAGSTPAFFLDAGRLSQAQSIPSRSAHDLPQEIIPALSVILMSRLHYL